MANAIAERNATALLNRKAVATKIIIVTEAAADKRTSVLRFLISERPCRKGLYSPTTI
ncbi:uncharacterized protein METZ01_LOCUS8191 [marine metagenome]|uniref:Uncharacterized protein n=1 Tax=marine metagenome TaxID=408172 RepID=A0A381NLC6_9ZZZZ